MNSFSTLTGLACSQTDEVVSADQPRNLSAAGFPLLAQYDLKKRHARCIAMRLRIAQYRCGATTR